ncbi:MAG: dihydropteroate synthase, partial [Chthoniobacterales bacterium]|nr:dihydropteroate synthase [Chthoniobacterales bacterium]
MKDVGVSGVWRARGHIWDTRQRPVVMGILNLTPDSFSDGGKYRSVEEAVEAGLRMVEEGAEILDLGGESTRPGAKPVALEEELRRVIPVLERLRPLTKVAISIDTSKAEVARQALELGADIVNDVTALRGDERMLEVVAGSECGVVLMHMQGRPETMQIAPKYEDAPTEVFDFLRQRMEEVERAGVMRERICLDPGLGF